jgi:NADH-quinone oxidoreductase subunit J
VAIIAAIALTLRARKDSKSQNPSEQVRVKRADRVTLVKMKSVVPGSAAVVVEEKKA